MSSPVEEAVLATVLSRSTERFRSRQHHGLGGKMLSAMHKGLVANERRRRLDRYLATVQERRA